MTVCQRPAVGGAQGWHRASHLQGPAALCDSSHCEGRPARGWYTADCCLQHPWRGRQGCAVQMHPQQQGLHARCRCCQVNEPVLASIQSMQHRTRGGLGWAVHIGRQQCYVCNLLCPLFPLSLQHHTRARWACMVRVMCQQQHHSISSSLSILQVHVQQLAMFTSAGLLHSSRPQRSRCVCTALGRRS